MSQYMLMIRNEETDFSKFSPKDFQELMKKYEAWTKKLIDSGVRIAGEKLTKDLGPYADSKDAVGGFYIIKAKDLSEAVEVARGCPARTYGGSVSRALCLTLLAKPWQMFHAFLENKILASEKRRARNQINN